MPQIYLLGGLPRTAKSTILSKLAGDKNIPYIATDAMQEGMRNMLIGKPHQMLRSIELSGWVQEKALMNKLGNKTTFDIRSNETELTQKALIGMAFHYIGESSDIAFEGAVITPEWTSKLVIPNCMVKAAFVGYTNPNYGDRILAYAKKSMHDWINEWIQTDKGDDTNIREWISDQAVKGQQLKNDAECLGFSFFDVSDMPFEEYVSAVQADLLG